MEQLSNTNDILFSWLGWAPLILAVGMALLVVRRNEQVTSLLYCVSTRTYAMIVPATIIIMAGICSLVRFKVSPFGDSDRYLVRALNVVQYGVFGYGTSPTAWYPPGYSFMLIPAAAVFGNSRWAFFLTNITLLAGVAVGVRFLLQKLGIPGRVANLVSLLILLYPDRLLSTLIPASDIPFSLTYLCAFLFMTLSITYPARWHYPLITGLVAGVAALIRANGLPLMIPLGVGLLCSYAAPGRLRARNTALLLVSMLCIVIPWTIRNGVLLGVYAPVSDNFGINLAIGNNSSRNITYDVYVDSLWMDPNAGHAPGHASWTEAELDSFYVNRGLEYIRQHPAQFVGLGFRKVFHTVASGASTFGMLETYTNLRTVVFSAFPNLPARSATFAGIFVVYSLCYRALFILNNAAYYSSIMLVMLILYRHRHRFTGPAWAYLTAVAIACALVFILFGISRYKEPLPLLTLVLPCLALFQPPPRADVPGPARAGAAG